MYYAYLLQCADNTIYAGYTNDLSQRIEAHNNGHRSKIYPLQASRKADVL